jgi:hypothetical protein
LYSTHFCGFVKYFSAFKNFFLFHSTFFPLSGSYRQNGTRGGNAMPEQTSFAVLYKKLLDSNFDPGPERAKAAMNTVLRRLSQGPPPKA